MAAGRPSYGADKRTIVTGYEVYHQGFANGLGGRAEGGNPLRSESAAGLTLGTLLFISCPAKRKASKLSG